MSTYTDVTEIAPTNETDNFSIFVKPPLWKTTTRFIQKWECGYGNFVFRRTSSPLSIPYLYAFILRLDRDMICRPESKKYHYTLLDKTENQIICLQVTQR